MKAVITALALSLAATATSAQTFNVHIVDDDGGAGVFTDIQSAIDFAIEDDIIIVRNGVYDPFTIDGKGVLVHRDSQTEAPLVYGPIVIKNIGANSGVTLRGLDIDGVPVTLVPPTAPPPVIEITDCAGHLWLEDLRTNTGATPPPFAYARTGVVVENSASVIFAACELTAERDPLELGPMAAVTATDSALYVYASTLQGGARQDLRAPIEDTADGKPGLELDGGSLFSSASTFRGGDGVDGMDRGSCAHCEAGSGGDGLVLAGGAPTVHMVETTTEGGLAGVHDDPLTGSCTTVCADGVDGQGMVVASGSVSTTPGVARVMGSGSPVRETLQPVVLGFIGEPGDAMVMVISTFHVNGVTLPDPTVIGPGFIGNPFFFLGAGVVPAAGQKFLSFDTTDLLYQGFDSIPIYYQTLHIDANLNIWVGSTTVVLLIEESF